MALVLREVKGSKLTIPEMDGNLTYLQSLTYNTGSFATTGMNTFNGDQQVNGKITATSFTGSLLGTASLASTASYVSLAQTASYVQNAITASYVLNAVSSSYAATSSYSPLYLPLTGGTINGNIIINGTASVTFLNATYESASIIYSSGSNQFGDATNDIQTLIGTVFVSGSQQITGSLGVLGNTGINGNITATSLIKSGGLSSQTLRADGSVFDNYNASITAGAQIETTSNTDIVATGLEFTPPAGTYTIDFNGHYLSIPGNVVEIATLDLQTLTLYINNLTATGTHGLSFGSGETLTAGIYDVAGAMSIAGVLTLSGGVNDIFVFRSAGALNTASFTSVLLTGGVKSANVFFLANGALGLGANNVLSGNFISVGSAGALGANATFNGRLLSTAGSIAFGAGSISKPTDVSLVPMGILESFLGFTNGGGIQNTALAVITGNLGTGSSVVSIFTGSVFNGVAFDVTQPLGDTNVFSLYQGETQIPFTERFRYYNTYVEDVALLGTATVDGTESISVRWRTDIGKVILANRIFKINKVYPQL